MQTPKDEQWNFMVMHIHLVFLACLKPKNAYDLLLPNRSDGQKIQTFNFFMINIFFTSVDKIKVRFIEIEATY